MAAIAAMPLPLARLRGQNKAHLLCIADTNGLAALMQVVGDDIVHSDLILTHFSPEAPDWLNKAKRAEAAEPLTAVIADAGSTGNSRSVAARALFEVRRSGHLRAPVLFRSNTGPIQYDTRLNRLSHGSVPLAVRTSGTRKQGSYREICRAYLAGDVPPPNTLGTAPFDLSSWRPVFRIGIMGGLEPAPFTTVAAVQAFGDYLAMNPEVANTHLEVVSPNAPGFDRVAAHAVAAAWQEQTGRPARILLVDVAGRALVDWLAAEAIAQRTSTPLGQVLANCRSQSLALKRLSGSGHDVRNMRVTPVGLTDTQVAHDYGAAILAGQDHVMRLADLMLFDLRGRVGTWTQAAMKKWRSLGREALVVS